MTACQKRKPGENNQPQCNGAKVRGGHHRRSSGVVECVAAWKNCTSCICLFQSEATLNFRESTKFDAGMQWRSSSAGLRAIPEKAIVRVPGRHRYKCSRVAAIGWQKLMGREAAVGRVCQTGNGMRMAIRVGAPQKARTRPMTMRQDPWSLEERVGQSHCDDNVAGMRRSSCDKTFGASPAR